MAMGWFSLRALLVGAAVVSLTSTLLAQPQGSGALQPQQTSPLPGVTPATQGAPPAPAPSPSVVAPAIQGRVFTAERGVIFNAIRPDTVTDFETVLGRRRQALDASKDPVRSNQGKGWRIFKATEPGPNGSVLYVFVLDPVVKDADYGVAKILAEAYPSEIAELYRMYSGAFSTAGQTLLNLQTAPSPAATTPGSSPPLSPGTSSPLAP